MMRLRALTWPLVPVYGAALAVKDALRAVGVLPRRALHWPVISVGSVSAGGAGKTPVVLALARLLCERGWQVDILSRGYRRSSRGVQRVDPLRPDAGRVFGDEPVLLAARTGVPVWVSGKRFRAGLEAERTAGLDPGPDSDAAEPLRAHLLDDGFQHRGLGRQFDLLVVTAKDLGDTLLPAGNLREPLTALRRADAFAVREDELEGVARHLERLGQPDTPIWTLRRSLHFPAPLGIFAAGLRPLAFCGLARPEDFAGSLAAAGCGVVDTVVFPDHHAYGEDDLLLLLRVARQLSATGLVTTEKDAVKLPEAMQNRLRTEAGALVVVRLDVDFVYASPVVRALEQRLRPARDGLLPVGAETR